MRRLFTYGLFLWITCFVSPFLFSQELVLNEVMYDNKSVVFDEDNDSPDWIEIYNSTSEPINLEDYKLTDDLSEEHYWTFPGYVLLPGDFLVIFASGKNRKDTSGFHTDFRLGLMEDPIYLLTPNNQVIDSFGVTCVPRNTSYGHYPDGSDKLVNFSPTPGISNNNAEVTTINYIEDTLTVNYGSGFYKEGLNLKFKNKHPENSIYYTLDGDMPKNDDNKFLCSLSLSDISGNKNRFTDIEGLLYKPGNNIYKGNIVRAVVYSCGCPASNVITNTYFTSKDNVKKYPVNVISLVTEKDNLVDDDIGIYVKGKHNNYNQHGKKWERTAHIEMFDTCGIQFVDQDAGIRINGRGSRASDQKSFRLYAREKYGKDSFQHPFFPGKPELTSFKTLIIRSCRDWSSSLIKDELAHSLVQDMNVNYMAHETSVLFVNGEYWGIYSLRERNDEYYIHNNFNKNTDELDIIGHDLDSIIVEEGNMLRYNELIDFINNSDPLAETYYTDINDKIDLDELIDYFIAQIYLANSDWPQNNLKIWNTGEPDEKWHYFFFDCDGCMIRSNYDVISEFTDNVSKNFQRCEEWSIEIISHLLENDEFNYKFMQRFYNHLSSTFETGRVLELIDEFEQRYEPLVTEQIYRWNVPIDVLSWKRNVEALRSFAVQRPPDLMVQLKNNFPNPFTIYPNPANGSFNIDFANLEQESSIKIYNSNGMLVHQRIKPSTLGMLTISDQFSPGMYFLDVSINGLRFTDKLIITP